MDIFIRFIGLMLIVQLQANGPYHVIIPKWEAGDKFCGVQIMEHAAFVRVSTANGQVHNDAAWSEKKDCDTGLNCRTYEVPVESTVTIDGGFTPVTPASAVTLPCFVPHLKKEKLVKDDTLHKNALKTLSIADFEIPRGELTANQFSNDMIFVAARLEAPQGTTLHEITVTATPRAGGTPRVLVLAPGTLIDLIDLPRIYAGGDYDAETHNPAMNGHFFFLDKLLANFNPSTDCNTVPGVSPGNCKPHIRDHKGGSGATLNLSCGPGGP